MYIGTPTRPRHPDHRRPHRFEGLGQVALAQQAVAGAISELRHLQEGLSAGNIQFGTPALPLEHWTPQLTIQGATWFSKGARTAALDAINRAADGTAAYPGTVRLDCLAAIQLAAAQGLRTALGDRAFDSLAGKLAAGGTLLASPPAGMLHVRVSAGTSLVRGDLAYFQNPPEYRRLHPGGPWQGENTVYLGEGLFLGFVVGELPAKQLAERLAAEYNAGITDAGSRITAARVIVQPAVYRFDEALLKELENKAQPKP